MGVLVHFKTHPDYPMDEMNEALGIVHDTANEDADVIFGTTSDESLDKDCVEITIVATGFEKDVLKASPSENSLRMLNFGDDAPTREENEAIKKATRKVSGGFDIDVEDLDTPTYHRRRMD